MTSHKIEMSRHVADRSETKPGRFINLIRNYESAYAEITVDIVMKDESITIIEG
jgi:hypothetical protein